MFLINCTNKKCGKTQDAKLDKDTDEVFCSECEQSISGVSHFIKAAMRSTGAFRKSTVQEAFAIKCHKCKKNAKPKLQKNELVCPGCNTLHANVPPVYANMIKQHLKPFSK